MAGPDWSLSGDTYPLGVLTGHDGFGCPLFWSGLLWLRSLHSKRCSFWLGGVKGSTLGEPPTAVFVPLLARRS